MITVTFKNVGQGDTIILEWERDGERRVGIIDCNKFPDKNPALDFIINENLTEVYFLLLTHPHYDHFSGFNEVINHCIENEIKIKYFMHTSERVPEYLEYAGNGDEEFETELENLYLNVDRLFNEQNTQNIYLRGFAPDDDFNKGKDIWYLNKNENLYLKVLAPRTQEYNDYSRQIQYKWDEEDKNGNPNANYLSSVIQIVVDKFYILLTADAPKRVFGDFLHEINSGKRNDFNEGFLLGQVPHHGSQNNFRKGFWKKIKGSSSAKAMISVGENIYGHPNSKVVDTLQSMRYQVYATNRVGCLIEKNEVVMSHSISAGTHSLLTATLANDDFSGDKSFLVNKSGIALI